MENNGGSEISADVIRISTVKVELRRESRTFVAKSGPRRLSSVQLTRNYSTISFSLFSFARSGSPMAIVGEPEEVSTLFLAKTNRRRRQ